MRLDDALGGTGGARGIDQVEALVGADLHRRGPGAGGRQPGFQRLAGVGEPLFSYFAPDDIAAQLRTLGFTGIEDHSAPDLIAGYLHGSAGFEGEPPRALHAIRILHASR